MTLQIIALLGRRAIFVAVWKLSDHRLILPSTCEQIISFLIKICVCACLNNY